MDAADLVPGDEGFSENYTETNDSSDSGYEDTSIEDNADSSSYSNNESQETN